MMHWKEMPEHSRVWIYQATRPFTPEEQAEIKASGEGFISGWNAHGSELLAAFELFHDRFVVIFLDEQHAAASGCSIDKSVALMKSIEQQYDVELLNRMVVAWRENGNVNTCSLQQFEELIGEGKINQETIVFNNLVSTKSEFEASWETPLKNSWHARLAQMG